MNNNRLIAKDSDLRRAADNLEYFVNYVSSPWRIIWMNFVAGIFRGLGAIIGASIVIGLVIWVLGLFTKIPLLSEYTQEVDEFVSEYIYKTDYNEELDQMNETLRRIEESLKNRADP